MKPDDQKHHAQPASLSPPVRPEIMRWIQRLRLIDDYFMQVCFQDCIECVELVLRIILDKPDLVVQRVSAQKSLANLYGQGSRLDIFAVDSENRPYDIEIQRASRGAQPRRARFYSSLLDANQKETGKDYELLPESYVIFITERDVLRLGQPLYKIERQIVGTDKLFCDGAHIIYVNGEMREGDTALARLMHDFFCANPAEMHYEPLAHVTGFHKTDSKEVVKMSSTFEAFAEEIEKQTSAKYLAQGMEQGMAQGMEHAGRTFALKLLADGFSCEDIARYTALPLDTVLELAAQHRAESN